MNGRWDMARAWAIAAVAVLLNACATQIGTVELLPEKDGKGAAVTVKQGDQQVVLSEPYAAAKLTTAGPQAYQSNPEEVQALFGAALAHARPMSQRSRTGVPSRCALRCSPLGRPGGLMTCPLAWTAP